MKHLFILCILSLCFVGCKSDPYILKGKVLEANRARIEVVSDDDERLTYQGVNFYRMNLKIDPDRIEEFLIGNIESDETGTFKTPVNHFGAGFLLYDLGITGRKQGYIPTFEKLPLPKKNQSLLVFVKRGRDYNNAGRDAIGETLKMIPPKERPSVGKR